MDLFAAFALTVAVALGGSAAFGYLKNGHFGGRGVGIVHGLAGAAGAGGLLALLQGPRRGDATGVGDFGIFAAILFAVALTIGPFIVYLAKRRPRLGGIAMALHAGTAIVGFVLFQAWRALG